MPSFTASLTHSTRARWSPYRALHPISAFRPLVSFGEMSKEVTQLQELQISRQLWVHFTRRPLHFYDTYIIVRNHEPCPLHVSFSFHGQTGFCLRPISNGKLWDFRNKTLFARNSNQRPVQPDYLLEVKIATWPDERKVVVCTEWTLRSTTCLQAFSRPMKTVSRSLLRSLVTYPTIVYLADTFFCVCKEPGYVPVKALFLFPQIQFPLSIETHFRCFILLCFAPLSLIQQCTSSKILAARSRTTPRTPVNMPFSTLSWLRQTDNSMNFSILPHISRVMTGNNFSHTSQFSTSRWNLLVSRKFNNKGSHILPEWCLSIVYVFHMHKGSRHIA